MIWIDFLPRNVLISGLPTTSNDVALVAISSRLAIAFQEIISKLSERIFRWFFSFPKAKTESIFKFSIPNTGYSKSLPNGANLLIDSRKSSFK